MNAPTPETTPRERAERLLEQLGITHAAAFIPHSSSEDKAEQRLTLKRLHWQVTIKTPRGELTTPYSAGTAHLPPPLNRYPLQGNYDLAVAISEACETGKYRKNYEATFSSPKPLPPPPLADIMHCLVLDCDVMNYPRFEDWAESLGYDPDSREAERTYRTCLANAVKLQYMVGAAGMEQLRDAYQDY